MRSSVGIAFFLASALVPLGFTHSARAGELTPQKFRSDPEKFDLLAQLTAPWKSVSRWRVEYDVMPLAPIGSRVPVHRVMAVSGPADFYSMTAHAPRSEPWQVDPFSQEVFIHNDVVSHRWIFNRTFSETPIQSGDNLPGSTWMDVLFLIVPRWPLSRYAIPHDPSINSPVVLIQALQSSPYRLAEELEEVNGEKCLIFDNQGLDRLWISSSKSLCLMRRDTRDPHSGKLSRRILTDKIEKVGPHLWLPTQYRIQFFNSSSAADGEVLERASQIQILHCALDNDVPETAFVPIPAPGAIKFVTDSSSEFSQVAPGGEDQFERISSFLTKYEHLPARSAAVDFSYVWLLIGLAGGFASSFYFFGKRTDPLPKKQPLAEPPARVSAFTSSSLPK